MIGPRLQSLRVVQGELPSSDKWNRMLDMMDEIAHVHAGPGAMRKSLPTRTIIRATRGVGKSSGGGSYPLRASLGAGAQPGQMSASFNLGYIAGVEPRIGPKLTDLLISDKTVPVFTFNVVDVVDPKTGIGFLYWEMKFNNDYSILNIYPAVYKNPPSPPDYTADKLIGIFRRDPAVTDQNALPSYRQMLFYNLGHVATQRHGGKALHHFWAQ